MTHALRQNCGSFLQENISRDWLTEAEKQQLSSKSHPEMDDSPWTTDMETVPSLPSEWPLFDAPVLSSVRVTGYVEKNGTTFFIVCPIMYDFQWTVQKSYDQFSSLHKVLVHDYKVDKNLLPSRGLFGFFSTPKKSELVEMQSKLENMLNTIIRTFPAAPNQLFRFLGYPFCDVLSITDGLGKFFAQQGEMVISQNKAVELNPVQLYSINRRMMLPVASSETGQLKDDFGHLLDFVQNLKKLKIMPPAEQSFSVRNSEQVTFDLSLMKSLEILLVESISMHQFQGRHQLPGQLTTIEIRRTINSLKDLLVVYSPSDSDYYEEPSIFEAPPGYTPTTVPTNRLSLGAPADYSRALRWEHLRQATFRLNQLRRMDDSLQLLPFLEKLDLSYNYIEHIENLTELPHLRVLDLSHNKISDLTELHKKMGNIKKLSLGSNNITTLKGVEKTFSLEYFDLSNNHISDVSEVGYLSKLVNLGLLFMKGNPIEQSPSYRSQVFSHLPQTDEKVALDGKKASIDEQYISISLNTPTLGHKRVPSRTADITADLDEEETKEAQAEVEKSLSQTIRLEELRKEGGDKWLAILNADKENTDEEVVSTKRKKKKANRTHRSKKTTKKSPEESLVSSTDVEVSMSPALAELLADHSSEPQEPTTGMSYQVTVHEYAGALQTLSTEDMDQLLLNARLEECSVTVDSSLNRILEIIVAVNKTRSQRDLALLSDMKIHEGKRLSLCLQFTSLGSSSYWVVYCVPTMNALARLYKAVKEATKNRSTTPEPSLELLDVARTITKPVKSTNPFDPEPTSDSSPAIERLNPPTETTDQATSSLESNSKVSVKSSAPSSPKSAHSQTNLTKESDPLLPNSDSIKSRSASSSPVIRRSPIHLEAPREVTPEPSVQYSQEFAKDQEDESAVTSASALSEASRNLPEPIVVDKPIEPVVPRTYPPKVIKKPGLEDEHLANFFRGIVALDSSEFLVSVVWGGCILTASPDCEIEVGLLVSDKAVYLLEVLDPYHHQKRELAWDTDSLPLACIMSCPLATLTNVSTGLFDQSVLLEFVEKGLLKSCAVLPRKYDQMVSITENLKAVLDNSKIDHVVMSTQDAIISPTKTDGAFFITSDTSDILKLKEDLIWPKIVTQVGNFIAVSSKSESVLTSRFETEVKRNSEDQAQKFEIVQQIIVGEISTDSLPLSIGQPHLKSRTLVIAGESIYLCKESLVSWPKDGSIHFPFPRTVVLDSHPLKCVSKIKICDKAQHIVLHADPVYEFVIKFEVADEPPGTEKSVFKWKLVVQNREYLDQFMTSLTQLWNDLKQSELTIIHTADSITDALSLQPVAKPPVSPRKIGPVVKSRSPRFFHSEVLLEFARQSNYQRLKFFKNHVAQAEFMKSDEVPLCTFLSHCSSSSPQGKVEIETCVLVSNYALYFLSDVDCIKKWLDDSGPSSYQRMSLLSKQDSSVRCFYRVWLNEVKEVKIGLFHLSATLRTTQKSGSENDVITIHTDNQFTTVSFLSALSGTFNLQNTAEKEELSDLLSDYCDLISESVSIQKDKKGSKMTVECIPHPDIDIDKLKQILISISPSITKNTSMENVAASMHILCAQVMLQVEELHIRDAISAQAKPHLVHLTNYGLYVCRNASDENSSPSVAAPSDLRVKKWCHIDLIEKLSIKLPTPPNFLNPTLHISIRTPQASVSSKDSGMTFLAQNCELLSVFVHLLSNLWSTRTGKHLPVHTH